MVAVVLPGCDSRNGTEVLRRKFTTQNWSHPCELLIAACRRMTMPALAERWTDPDSLPEFLPGGPDLPDQLTSLYGPAIADFE